MDELNLSKVEDGLGILIKRYQLNNNPTDSRKLMATIDAKKAIRKVIMLVAVNGDISDIKPIFDRKHGMGWEILDYKNVIKRVFSESIVNVTNSAA